MGMRRHSPLLVLPVLPKVLVLHLPHSSLQAVPRASVVLVSVRHLVVPLSAHLFRLQVVPVVPLSAALHQVFLQAPAVLPLVLPFLHLAVPLVLPLVARVHFPLVQAVVRSVLVQVQVHSLAHLHLPRLVLLVVLQAFLLPQVPNVPDNLVGIGKERCGLIRILDIIGEEYMMLLNKR